MSTHVDIDKLIHTETTDLDTRGRKRITVGEEFAGETVKIIVLNQEEEDDGE